MKRKSAAPRVKVGADVLPWWPVKGVYLLLERGDVAAADALLDVDGVAGIWSAATLDVDASLASAHAGQTITYCFLDDDPVATAERLRPVLTTRWSATVSSRCWPRRFTPSYRTSGIAMCRRRFPCGSA